MSVLGLGGPVLHPHREPVQVFESHHCVNCFFWDKLISQNFTCILLTSTPFEITLLKHQQSAAFQMLKREHLWEANNMSWMQIMCVGGVCMYTCIRHHNASAKLHPLDYGLSDILVWSCGLLDTLCYDSLLAKVARAYRYMFLHIWLIFAMTYVKWTLSFSY